MNEETENSANMNAQKKNDYLLPGSILIAAVLIAGSVLYTSKKSPVVPEKQLAAVGAAENAGSGPEIKGEDPILGNPNAPVAIVEYGDYQCPFCGRFFSQTMPQIKKEYIDAGKAKFVFKNFQFLGPESVAAAVAAECAKDQNKFFEYHDALFGAEIQDGRENNGNLNRDLFLTIAENLKLNPDAFAKCIDSNAYESKIQSDTADAQATGVNSTPTTFINDQKISGALPFAQFKPVIDSFL